MAGSSDTLSSALSYALEQLGTPSLTLKRRTAVVPRGGISRKFSVCMVTVRIWQEHLPPSSPIRDRVQERAMWYHTLLLLAKTIVLCLIKFAA